MARRVIAAIRMIPAVTEVFPVSAVSAEAVLPVPSPGSSPAAVPESFAPLDPPPCLPLTPGTCEEEPKLFSVR